MSESTMTNAPTHLRRLADAHGEPGWLLERRERAWAQFEAMPVPRLEKTDISKRSWDIGRASGTVAAADSQLVLNLVEKTDGTPTIYVKDGVVVSAKLPESLAKQGVVFTSLQEAALHHGDVVQKHLGTAVRDEDTKWSVLNAALWEGGAFLYVPRNVTVDEPFLFVYSQTESALSVFPRVLVVGDEGSRFSITEVIVEASDASASIVHSVVAEVIAGPASQVTYCFVNRFRKGSTHFVTRRALVAQDGEANFVGSDVGDGFTVSAIESHLRGNGSRANTQMVGLGYGRQRIDLTASMVHIGKYSESDIKLYGVLRERANSLYRSSTQIIEGAVAAGSEQSDRMLVVDSTARADAIPMLLIDENDVQRCGHAASVGKLDPNHIYYMMSRGIPESLARRMIVWGYLQPALEAMPIEAVRMLATTMVDEVLG